MFSATVLYPKTPDSHFDLAYYLDSHTPLVREVLTPEGLVSVELRAGMAGAAPDSLPAYAMICQLNFGTLEETQNALTKHGPELMADIPNFTDVLPEIQISESVEGSEA